MIRMAKITTWTTERVKFLKAKWGTLTAREIAEALGNGVTRCSVLGAAHRHNLPPSPFRTQPHEKQIKPMIAIIEPVEETTPGISMMELTESTCRWPSGDPRKECSFCGKKTARASQYCPLHTVMGLAANQSRFHYKEYSREKPDNLNELTEIVK